jgi:hypothetical protein
MDGITANTGNAPIKPLGQTKGQSFGTNSRTPGFDNGVTEEDNGKSSKR